MVHTMNRISRLLDKWGGRPAKAIEWVLLLTTAFYTGALGAQYYSHGGFDTFTQGFFGTLQLVFLVLLMVDAYAMLRPKWKPSRQIRLISLAAMILASLFYSIMQIIDPLTADPLWIYSLGMAAISFIIHLSVRFEIS